MTEAIIRKISNLNNHNKINDRDDDSYRINDWSYHGGETIDQNNYGVKSHDLDEQI